jgi:hypothetical protein
MSLDSKTENQLSRKFVNPIGSVIDAMLSNNVPYQKHQRYNHGILLWLPTIHGGWT